MMMMMMMMMMITMTMMNDDGCVCVCVCVRAGFGLLPPLPFGILSVQNLCHAARNSKQQWSTQPPPSVKRLDLETLDRINLETLDGINLETTHVETLPLSTASISRSRRTSSFSCWELRNLRLEAQHRKS